MFLRSAFKYTSYFFLIKVIVDKVLSGKVRFQTMIVPKTLFEDLVKPEKKLKALLFSSAYDNRTIAKDRITLEAYALSEDDSGPMKRIPIFLSGMDDKFAKEISFSGYGISIKEIRDIAEEYQNDSLVVYFIFKPTLYSLDNNYISYLIIPADINKNPIKKRTLISNNSFERNMQNKDLQQDSETNDIATQAMAMRYEFEIAAVLDPCPPARPRHEI